MIKMSVAQYQHTMKSLRSLMLLRLFLFAKLNITRFAVRENLAAFSFFDSKVTLIFLDLTVNCISKISFYIVEAIMKNFSNHPKINNRNTENRVRKRPQKDDK